MSNAKITAREAATSVKKNKAKYIVLIMSAIIFPAGFILGPIALVKEIKRDNSKKAQK